MSSRKLSPRNSSRRSSLLAQVKNKMGDLSTVAEFGEFTIVREINEFVPGQSWPTDRERTDERPRRNYWAIFCKQIRL